MVGNKKDMYNTFDDLPFEYYYPYSFKMRNLEYLKLRKNRNHLKYKRFNVTSPTLKRKF